MWRYPKLPNFYNIVIFRLNTNLYHKLWWSKFNILCLWRYILYTLNQIKLFNVILNVMFSVYETKFTLHSDFITRILLHDSAILNLPWYASFIKIFIYIIKDNCHIFCFLGIFYTMHLKMKEASKCYTHYLQV